MKTAISQTRKRAAADLDDSRRQLGVKLKLARQTKGLTLKELAKRSDCSESLLSKVENGRVLPSLPLVHRLVRVLETNISWLFEETGPEEAFIHRPGERPVITLDQKLGGAEGISLERIIPFKNGHLLQCNIHHIDVGGQSGDTITHEGEEVGYVLEGLVELFLDGEAHELKPGDAFCFRSHIPHSYRNVGEEPASILWICTPPTF